MVFAITQLATSATFSLLAAAGEVGPGISYALQYTVAILGVAMAVAVACRRSKR